MCAYIWYHKPERLIEQVTGQPMTVISKVFETHPPGVLQHCLYHWLKISVNYIYKDAYKRLFLYNFHDGLQILMAGLEIMELHYRLQQKEKQPDTGKITHAVTAVIQSNGEMLSLSKHSQQCPMSLIYHFFDSFSIQHARSELWDWLLAGAVYTAELPKELITHPLLLVYDSVLCLTEAARVLHVDERSKLKKEAAGPRKRKLKS